MILLKHHPKIESARDYGAATSSRANANPTEISNITNYAVGTFATSHFGYLTTPSPSRQVDRYDFPMILQIHCKGNSSNIGIS